MAIIDMVYKRNSSTGEVLFDVNGYPQINLTATTGANTYGQLQTRVQNETLGAATLNDVQNAIQDAIQTFESQDFWFNSVRYFGDVTGSQSNLQTVQGKEFYSYQDLPVLSNMPHISKILVLAFNNRYPLFERTSQWIDDQSLSPTWNGMPTDWCMIAGSLRLYPIPNQTYPLILDGTTRFPPLVNDSDYNCWSNRGEYLIRSEAKRRLFVEINRDEEQALEMEHQVYGDPNNPRRQGALDQLRRETTRRAGGSGRIRSSARYL